ncbi:MAG: hypothetical protein ACFFA4_04100 [Promethearchaeota archaeon]
MICNKCGKFTDTFRKYCEACGAKYSLRKANKKDFNFYILKTQQPVQDQLKEDISVPQQDRVDIATFLKEYHYICIYCWEFSIKNPGYCKKCGSRYSLRKAKKKYFGIYNVRRENYMKNQAQKQKFIPKPIIDSPSPEFIKTDMEPSTSDTWKEKIKDISTTQPEIAAKMPEVPPPVSSEIFTSEPPQMKLSELQPIPSESVKELEKVKLISNAQNDITTPDLKLLKQKPISSIQDKKEEKAKEIFYFCKFCGMKLEHLEKYCQQCGTIIKNR